MEPSRILPVQESYDVIVCGAGPAGVCAAIASARQGARTLLIEAHGALGGIWTTGLLSFILDSENKEGIIQEILDKLEGMGARNGMTCDVESMKLVLEQLCLQACVHIRLHTRVAAAVLDDENRVAMIITESKSGREAWGAQVFVDATGDGDLSAFAGCSFAYGQDGTAKAQPMSMIALLTGVDPEAALPYYRIKREARQLLFAAVQAGGVTPSYGSPALWHIRDDLYILMANHEYGVSGLNAADLTSATLSSRAELHRIVTALRSTGGLWSNLRLVATAAQIGVREGRRVEGRYVVTVDDILNGVRHEDAVCRVRFKVDVHALDGKKTSDFEHYNYSLKPQPYDIPARALIAKDVDGLLLAGRCISGDFLSHASYRVTGNAAPIGEAAGLLAAASIKLGVLPQDVPYSQLQQWLPPVHDAVRKKGEV